MTAFGPSIPDPPRAPRLPQKPPENSKPEDQPHPSTEDADRVREIASDPNESEAAEAESPSDRT